MKSTTAVFLGALALLTSGCATQYSVSPIADASQQVRYWHGKPTTYSEMRLGAVQVTPLGVNSDDRVGFSVVVFNKSGQAANFGVENLSLVQADGGPGKIMTSAELEREAKVHAAWQTFAAALAGGAEMYAAARNSESTTEGTAYTPVGPVNYYARTYNPALAQANMQLASMQMSSNLRTIESSLDQKVEQIRGNILQTTTINPGSADGGIAVADTLSSSHFPQDVVLHVNWNGEDHAFKFTVAKGVDQIVQQASQPAAPPTAAEIAMNAPQQAPDGFADTGVVPVVTSYDHWQPAQPVGAKSSSPQHAPATHAAATIEGAVY